MKARQLYQHVETYIVGGSLQEKPVWYDVLHNIPPSEIMVRTRPAQVNPPKRLRVPHKTFRPQQLVFPEDALRRRFFKDHPWELARPRLIIENDGTDSRSFDWSKGLRQPGLPLCGECVVQRQLWLMENKGMPTDEAYDKARKEFYYLRQKDEIEARVQAEESTMYGGIFGPSWVEVGVQLEDVAFREWLSWAKKSIAQLRTLREARSTGGLVIDNEVVSALGNTDQATGSTSPSSPVAEQKRSQGIVPGL